ncbi:WD40-repeat-containing domain protein [Cladochytrium replicatum]|nr:WD40-repeat-containing domain protein [Cladochytrium replicatum]
MADEQQRPVHKGVVMLRDSETDGAHQQITRLASVPKSPVVMQFVHSPQIEYIPVSRPATPQIVHPGVGPNMVVVPIAQSWPSAPSSVAAGSQDSKERLLSPTFSVAMRNNRNRKATKRAVPILTWVLVALAALIVSGVAVGIVISLRSNVSSSTESSLDSNSTTTTTTEETTTFTATSTTTTSRPAPSPTLAITQASRVFKPASSNQGNVMSLTLSSNGTRVVAGYRTGALQIWDTASGNSVSVAQVGSNATVVYGLDVSPVGDVVYAGSDDGMMRAYEIGDLSKAVRSFTHPQGVTSVTCTGDGKSVFTGCMDGIVRQWDATTGLVVRTFVGHSSTVWGVKISTDGTTLFTASQDQTARSFLIATAAPLRTYTGHTGTLMDLAVSRDGATLFTVSEDATTRIWNVVNATTTRVLKDHKGGVWAVALDRDRGSMVFTGGSTDQVALGNDVVSGNVTVRLGGHGAQVRKVVAGLAGSGLVYTASWDGSVRVFSTK